ncbi:hypothetical protein B566_EDAN004361 [Ephemera danica]|nr:hypothetical protein B566_EDAN004361 [Ephemera danica]
MKIMKLTKPSCLSTRDTHWATHFVAFYLIRFSKSIHPRKDKEDIWGIPSEVEFCGYTVPHPAEAKMNLRIQTTGPPAVDVLKKALQDLSAICDHTTKVFQVIQLKIFPSIKQCFSFSLK